MESLYEPVLLRSRCVLRAMAYREAEVSPESDSVYELIRIELWTLLYFNPC